LSEITTDVALVAVTVRVEELPCGIVVGVATIVTLRTVVLGITVTMA
jgi:hypothetical protein